MTLPALLDVHIQLLGRLPWLAAFFLRAFFLRDFFAMVGLLSLHVVSDRS